MKTYIVQEVIEGVACEPNLFFDETEANKCYVNLVNDNLWGDVKKAQNIDEAINHVNEVENMSDGYDIYYWEI